MTTSEQDLAILRKFATGADLADIERDLSIPREDVSAVIQGISFQRGRAAELVRQRESKQVRRANAPAADGLAITPQPATIENLLQRADTIPRLRVRAARIRKLIEDLTADIEASAAVVQAEQKVARLRAELEQANKALREIVRPKSTSPSAASTAPPVDADEPTPRTICAWASEHGVPCPPSGRIPGQVRQQYNTARSAA